MTKRPAGFSIVEVMVAFAILVLAVVPILTLYSTTARQTRQTGDYTLAIMLQERVAEDMRIASWENPHAVNDPRMLGDGTRAPIVNGQSIYFRGLEDTAAPFGQIDDDKDRSIDASFPDLYNQVKTYEFGVSSARRPLATQGEVLDVELDMQWKDGGDTTRAMPLRTVVPIIQPRITTPITVRDRTLADQNIHQVLFMDRPKSETLAQAAAATGADLEVVRALGDVMLVMGSLAITREEFNVTKQSLTDAVTAATDQIGRFRARVTLARYLEARAAAYVQAVVYLGDRVIKLAGSTDERLGNPTPDPIIYKDEMVMTAWLPRRMADSISETATAYTAAFNEDAALQLPRVRARVFMKILELCKIQALTAGLSDPAHIRNILASYNLAEAGRNINFAAYGQTEAELCASLESLRAAFRSPMLLDAYGSIEESAVPAVSAMVPPPADNGRGGSTDPLDLPPPAPTASAPSGTNTPTTGQSAPPSTTTTPAALPLPGGSTTETPPAVF